MAFKLLNFLAMSIGNEGKRYQKLKSRGNNLLISLQEFSFKNMPSRSRRGSDNKQEFPTISDGVMTELEGKLMK